MPDIEHISVEKTVPLDIPIKTRSANERPSGSDPQRSQELQACELAHQAIGSPDESILLWFTENVMHYPPRWMPVVLMALQEKNKEGDLRWRRADRPLALLSTIAYRAARNWRPELLFGGDTARAERWERTRRGEEVLSRYDQEGEEGGTYNVVLDREDLRYWYGSRSLPTWHSNYGVRRSHKDDPKRDIHVNQFLAKLGRVEGGGFERSADPEPMTEELLILRAVQIGVERTKKAGAEWLREAAQRYYSKIGLRRLVKAYKQKWDLHQRELTFDAQGSTCDRWWFIDPIS